MPLSIHLHIQGLLSPVFTLPGSHWNASCHTLFVPVLGTHVARMGLPVFIVFNLAVCGTWVAPDDVISYDETRSAPVHFRLVNRTASHAVLLKLFVSNF